MTGRSTKDMAQSNSETLQQWIADRYRLDDWEDYLKTDGNLNRSLIARELKVQTGRDSFSRSSLYTNEAHKTLLDKLEDTLREQGRIPQAILASPSERAVSDRNEKHVAELETRLKSLEERNATLVAENRDLKRKLDRYQLIDGHLAQTGRLLPQ